MRLLLLLHSVREFVVYDVPLLRVTAREEEKERGRGKWCSGRISLCS